MFSGWPHTQESMGSPNQSLGVICLNKKRIQSWEGGRIVGLALEGVRGRRSMGVDLDKYLV